MGYFSTGTEGADYAVQWCDNCIHDKARTESCPVWWAHLEHNYREANNPDSILHKLIPYENGKNGKCLMFVSVTTEGTKP